MKAICRDCHFLAKEQREENTGRQLSFTLNERERDLVRSDPTNAVDDNFTLKCHMGVWDEGVRPPASSRDITLNKTRRGTDCFFFPYSPAMLFEAARELQKRREENRQLKRSNLHTRIGLWIAAGALLANVIITLLKET
jgi:hypothetical protein